MSCPPRRTRTNDVWKSGSSCRAATHQDNQHQSSYRDRRGTSRPVQSSIMLSHYRRFTAENRRGFFPSIACCSRKRRLARRYIPATIRSHSLVISAGVSQEFPRTDFRPPGDLLTKNVFERYGQLFRASKSSTQDPMSRGSLAGPGSGIRCLSFRTIPPEISSYQLEKPHPD